MSGVAAHTELIEIGPAFKEIGHILCFYHMSKPDQFKGAPKSDGSKIWPNMMIEPTMTGIAYTQSHES